MLSDAVSSRGHDCYIYSISSISYLSSRQTYVLPNGPLLSKSPDSFSRFTFPCGDPSIRTLHCVGKISTQIKELQRILFNTLNWYNYFGSSEVISPQYCQHICFQKSKSKSNMTMNGDYSAIAKEVDVLHIHPVKKNLWTKHSGFFSLGLAAHNGYFNSR